MANFRDLSVSLHNVFGFNCRSVSVFGYYNYFFVFLIASVISLRSIIRQLVGWSVTSGQGSYTSMLPSEQLVSTMFHIYGPNYHSVSLSCVLILKMPDLSSSPFSISIQKKLNRLIEYPFSLLLFKRVQMLQKSCLFSTIEFTKGKNYQI